MHMLAANDATLPAALQHAYANAERLIMEIDIDDLDPAAAGAFTQTNGTLANGAPDLQEQLGKRRWDQVQRQCTRLSLPCDTLRRLEPWALALVMSVSELTRLGLDPQLGVEEQLRRQAAADHKEIGGLETLEFQLGLFDALRGPEQLQLLDMTLAEMGRQNDAVDKLSRAWRRGDLRTLEGLLLGEYRRFPALYDTLVYRRNASWVPRLCLGHGQINTTKILGLIFYFAT